jgi:hypothetical protein
LDNLTAQPVIEVFARGSFAGLHFWPNAFASVHYLAEPHRHVFYWEAVVRVSHDNRDVEFITLKQNIEKWLANYFPTFNDLAQLGTTSCEQLAALLVKNFHLSHCTVSEDNENGATVYA